MSQLNFRQSLTDRSRVIYRDLSLYRGRGHHADGVLGETEIANLLVESEGRLLWLGGHAELLLLSEIERRVGLLHFLELIIQI